MIITVIFISVVANEYFDVVFLSLSTTFAMGHNLINYF